MTLSAVVSLLLCVAACVLWVRSYWLWEGVAYQTTSGRLCTVTSRLGALSFDVTDGWPAGQFKPLELHSDPVLVAGLSSPSEWHLLGFGVDRHAQMVGVGDWTGPSSGTSIIVPYWLVSLLAMISALVMSFPLLIRRHRRRLGLCAACGYDLRGTPDRCPECGNVAAINTTAAA
ncbi:MAG TPA: hypothetical protein VGR35_07350 [Tepidisphaeraceae bacterium]|nr:hypothetical protein [Tepidisphaeraceae bacterium]